MNLCLLLNRSIFLVAPFHGVHSVVALADLSAPVCPQAVNSGSDGEATRPGPYPPLIPIGAPMMTTPFFPLLPGERADFEIHTRQQLCIKERGGEVA